MMKTKLFIMGLVFISTLIFFSTSHAADESGTIDSGWNIYSDGNLFFYLSGSQLNGPNCPITERWAFDTTTPLGKSFFSAFLTAYTTGKQIRVVGTGTCTHGNTETVAEFSVIN